MASRVVAFLALLFAALAPAPTLAHLLELPNKMALGRNEYLVVQQIYRGWDLRAQWAYSHAAGAVLNLVALVAVSLAVLNRERSAAQAAPG